MWGAVLVLGGGAKAEGSSGGFAFSGPTDYSVAGNPVDIVTADFNGDSNQDIATADASAGEVSVLLGDGHGGFGPSIQTEACDTACSAMQLVAGNFDGRQDLVVLGEDTGSGSSDEVNFLPGDGAGGFTGLSTVYANPASSAGTPTALAVGDFNGDGHLDLAIGTRGGQILVYDGNGSGGFTEGSELTAPSNITSLLATDINGDQKTDLVATDSSGVSVFENGGDGNSTGTFAPPTNYPVYGQVVRALPHGSSNGTPDLLVSNSGNQNNTCEYSQAGPYGTVSVLPNDGSGNFGGAPVESSATCPNSVAIGDFNGDGVPDLAYTDEQPGALGVDVMPGASNGSFGAPQQFAQSEETDALTSADFDGDGKPDIAVTNPATGSVAILLNESSQGAGTTTGPGGGTPSPLSNPVGSQLGALPGQQASGLVASFWDSSAMAKPGDFVAQINWGDGMADLGTITNALSQTDPGGPITNTFFVNGAHTYANKGSYNITVTVEPRDPAVPALTIPADAEIGPVPTNIGKGVKTGTGVGSGLLCGAATIGVLIPGIDVPAAVIGVSCGIAAISTAASQLNDPFDDHPAQVALPATAPVIARPHCPRRIRGRRCTTLLSAERAYLDTANQVVPIDEGLLITSDRFAYARAHHETSDQALQTAVTAVYAGYQIRAISELRNAGRRLRSVLRADHLSMSRLAGQLPRMLREVESAPLPRGLRRLLATQGVGARAAKRLEQRGFRGYLRLRALRSTGALVPAIPRGLSQAYHGISPLQVAMILEALNAQGAVSDQGMIAVEPSLKVLIAARSAVSRQAAAGQFARAISAHLSGAAAGLLEIATEAL